MKLYKFNYKNGSCEINNSPGFPPVGGWIAIAIGILMTVLALIYY